jgi:hypothetical protein
MICASPSAGPALKLLVIANGTAAIGLVERGDTALDGCAAAAMLTTFRFLSPSRGAMAVARRLPELLRRLAATVATLVAGLCCWPAPSEAYIEHPWCTRSGTTSCGFDSYEQCMENARLLTQTNCIANPWIHPLPQAPPHAHAMGAAARRR